MNGEYDNPAYLEDILHNGFQQRILNLEADSGGTETAVLVRRLADCSSGENLDPSVQKAVLYVHGFNDYFFQKEAAYFFNEKGYNFYGLDLRKCGRSASSCQKFDGIGDMRIYHEEILEVLKIIYLEGNQDVVLFGHSLGGLILTLFAKDYSDENLFDGLILNSPFYSFNTVRTKKTWLTLASHLARIMPDVEISTSFSEEYGKSLHKDSRGEWNYNLNWKPHRAPKIPLSWLRAAFSAHRELLNRFEVKKPVLVMCSGESLIDLTERKKIHLSDIVSDVRDISAVSDNIDGEIDFVQFDGGVYDLLLSDEKVRKEVYETIFGWLLKNDFL
ncbi:alpha/beta hydrolase [Methanimicrococcus hacksteinii]|uniref:alpha/beta hydrolase n=1 Tax=Methanimicrococcus hacksteinii TaxID=3028293 RepID=UPI00298EDB32|nr:alpha/beta hydrolase [Methanimicrococcus sp. At1]